MNIANIINDTNSVNNEIEDMNEEMQFVAFKLNEEEYAVDILNVQEIIRMSIVTRVPKAPAFLKGVINLRGVIIPVIDSHIRFNLTNKNDTDDSRIIVFRINDDRIGLTVDRVTEVLHLKKSDIEKTKGTNEQNEKNMNDFIKGIGKVDERLLIILDLEKVLECEIQQ